MYLVIPAENWKCKLGHRRELIFNSNNLCLLACPDCDQERISAHMREGRQAKERCAAEYDRDLLDAARETLGSEF
jgi:hypothetical protein